MLENLEQRLYFATASQSGGVVTITGDANDESITIDKSGSNIVITGDITGTATFSGATKVTALMMMGMTMLSLPRT